MQLREEQVTDKTLLSQVMKTEWGCLNVGLPCLLRHFVQLGRQSFQLYAPAALYPKGNSLVPISVRGWVDPWAPECGHLKIPKHPTGNRTRNLPSCCAVHQPTAPLATARESTLLCWLHSASWSYPEPTGSNAHRYKCFYLTFILILSYHTVWALPIRSPSLTVSWLKSRIHFVSLTSMLHAPTRPFNFFRSP
jgi:hypothetical protein